MSSGCFKAQPGGQRTCEIDLRCVTVLRVKFSQVWDLLSSLLCFVFGKAEWSSVEKETLASAALCWFPPPNTTARPCPGILEHGLGHPYGWEGSRPMTHYLLRPLKLISRKHGTDSRVRIQTRTKGCRCPRWRLHCCAEGWPSSFSHPSCLLLGLVARDIRSNMNLSIEQLPA